MGRQPWTTRLTVEDCPIQLCATSFHRNGVFKASQGTPIVLSWQSPEGSPLGRLSFEIAADGPHGRAIFIPAQFLDLGGTFEMGHGQVIPFTTTRPHWGGKRFWFVCGCGRRSARLYLPSGQTVFRCRLCYDLTYQSAQEHDKRFDAFRRAVAFCGWKPA